MNSANHTNPIRAIRGFLFGAVYYAQNLVLPAKASCSVTLRSTPCLSGYGPSYSALIGYPTLI